MSKSVQGTRAFALAELILVIVVAGIVAAALLSAMIALVRALQPRRISIAGEPLSVAPAFGPFPAAVRLHQVLAGRVADAKAIYVFGGQHLTLPAQAPAASVRPLRLRARPQIETFANGLPTDAKGLLEAYSAALGAEDPLRPPEDFTVVVIGSSGGRLAVTAFAQVERRDERIPDGTATESIVVRKVTLWDTDEGELSYAFAETPAQAMRVYVGAVHTWLRYQAGVVAEEGPACAVFPDPWVYAGTRDEAGAVPPYSRFTYLLAVSP